MGFHVSVNWWLWTGAWGVHVTTRRKDVGADVPRLVGVVGKVCGWSSVIYFHCWSLLHPHCKHWSAAGLSHWLASPTLICKMISFVP